MHHFECKWKTFSHRNPPPHLLSCSRFKFQFSLFNTILLNTLATTAIFNWTIKCSWKRGKQVVFSTGLNLVSCKKLLRKHLVLISRPCCLLWCHELCWLSTMNILTGLFNSMLNKWFRHNFLNCQAVFMDPYMALTIFK
jgi:hypothetical protein